MLIDIGIDARHDEWQLSSNFKVSETTHNQSISTRKCGGVGIRTATRAKVATKRKRKKSKLNRRTDNSSCKTRSQQTCLKRAAVAIVLTRRDRKYGETQTEHDRQTQLAVLVMTETGERRSASVTWRLWRAGRMRLARVGSGELLMRRDFSISFLGGRCFWEESKKKAKRERETLTRGCSWSLIYHPKMFYDLNVPYGADDPDISHTLNFLAERTSLGLLCCQFAFSIQDHMRS